MFSIAHSVHEETTALIEGTDRMLPRDLWRAFNSAKSFSSVNCRFCSSYVHQRNEQSASEPDSHCAKESIQPQKFSQGNYHIARQPS